MLPSIFHVCVVCVWCGVCVVCVWCGVCVCGVCVCGVCVRERDNNISTIGPHCCRC